MNKLRHILRYKIIIISVFILSLIYAIIYTKCITHKSVYDLEDKIFLVKVLEIKIDNNKINMLLKGKELLKATYYIDNNNGFNEIKLGDIIEVKGVLEEPLSNTIPNTFNYKKYLYNKKIYYVLKVDSIRKIENNTSIIYYLRQKISNKINKISKTSSYLQTFILGDKSYLNEEVYNTYKDNGISHLFSISGMHISLITTVLFYIIKRISYNNYINYGIVISLLILYTLILGMMASILRTIIMYILFAINKLLKLNISDIQLMLLVLIIAILINPFIIYDIGFQYSYVISFSLIILKKRLSKIKKYFFKSLYISFVAFMVSFPITIYNFYQVNIISIPLNLIMIPLVSIIIFPLSLITFIFPCLDNILFIFIQVLEFISKYIDKIEYTKIIFSKPHLLFIIIYYLIIYLSIYNKKYIIYFLILTILHKSIYYFDSSFKIVLLDVGQGDSILIRFPHNSSNILIDTGGIINSSYSILINKTIPYLKSIGITNIDYLILSHGDYDHMGESINLVENFKVEKVIFNCGEFNELEQELIKVLDKKKIPYYSCVKELNVDNNKLYSLNNKDYGNENDNSSVIYTKLNNHKFLFMGDAGVGVEEDLIEKYNLQDIDVLKVGHHGSKTSSGKEFINEINPKYSIISVGKNNRYGHPNKEVLDTLNDSKIYRTDQDGSIMFRIKKDKLQIETCSP